MKIIISSHAIFRIFYWKNSIVPKASHMLPVICTGVMHTFRNVRFCHSWRAHSSLTSCAFLWLKVVVAVTPFLDTPAPVFGLRGFSLSSLGFYSETRRQGLWTHGRKTSEEERKQLCEKDHAVSLVCKTGGVFSTFAYGDDGVWSQEGPQGCPLFPKWNSCDVYLPWEKRKLYEYSGSYPHSKSYKPIYIS